MSTDVMPAVVVPAVVVAAVVPALPLLRHGAKSASSGVYAWDGTCCS